MKIETEGPGQLRLKESFFSAYIAGIIMVVIGALLIYLGAQNLLSGDGDGGGWFMLVAGLALCAFGIIAFINGGSRYLTFNKDNGTLEIDNQTIRNKTKEVYDLTKLSKLVITRSLETSTSTSSRGSRSRTRMVNYYTLQFSDGHILELGRRSEGSVGMISSAVKNATGSSSLPVHIQKIVELTDVEVEHVNGSVGGLGNFFRR